MKNNLLCVFLLFFSIQFYGQSSAVIGKWKTIDEDGNPQSIVEIYEKSEKIYGKIIEIFQAKNKNKLCVKCIGEDKNKAILGLIVIKGLSKEDLDYTNGKILDPSSGMLYKCFITLKNNDKLKVRGYLGIPLFGRTKYWYRVKN